MPNARVEAVVLVVAAADGVCGGGGVGSWHHFPASLSPGNGIIGYSCYFCCCSILGNRSNSSGCGSSC